MRVVALLDLSALGKKGQKVETSISKNKYIVTGKLEIKKLFAFTLFSIWIWRSNRQEIQTDDRNVSLLRCGKNIVVG